MPHTCIIRNADAAITIVQCSEEDHENALEAQQKAVDTGIKEDAMFGGEKKPEACMKKSALEAMESLRAEDRLFGKLRCAHFRVVELSDGPSWLGVALVDVDPARIGKNIFGEMGTVAGRVVDIKKDQEVTKAGGRTTGTAHGTVNGVLADVYTTTKISKPQVTMITREWIVVSRDGPRYAVSGNGDSGSLFVTQQHAGGTQFYDVVAQLFSGGIRRNDSGTRTWVLANPEISVVTPAKRILEWLCNVMEEEMEFVDGFSD